MKSAKPVIKPNNKQFRTTVGSKVPRKYLRARGPGAWARPYREPGSGWAHVPGPDVGTELLPVYYTYKCKEKPQFTIVIPQPARLHTPEQTTCSHNNVIYKVPCYFGRIG